MLKINTIKKQTFMRENKFEDWPESYRREYLYKKHNNTCQKCGFYYKDKINGKGPFDMHHKDGNRENNKEENIDFICRNCHWMTDNFAGKKQNSKK